MTPVRCRVIKQNWIIWVRQNYFNILASRLLTETQECDNDNQILLKMTKKYFVTIPNIVVHRLLYCTHHLCSFPQPCTSWACSTDIGSGWFSGCYTAGSWCMVGSWSFVGWTDGRIPEIKRYALIILSCIGLHRTNVVFELFSNFCVMHIVKDYFVGGFNDCFEAAPSSGTQI